MSKLAIFKSDVTVSLEANLADTLQCNKVNLTCLFGLDEINGDLCVFKVFWAYLYGKVVFFIVFYLRFEKNLLLGIILVFLTHVVKILIFRAHFRACSVI